MTTQISQTLDLNHVLHNDAWEPWTIKKAGAQTEDAQQAQDEKPVTVGMVLKGCLLAENQQAKSPCAIRIKKYDLATRIVNAISAGVGMIELDKDDVNLIKSVVELTQPLLVFAQIFKLLA